MGGGISVPAQSEQQTDRKQRSKIGGLDAWGVADTADRRSIPVPAWSGDDDEHIARMVGHLGRRRVDRGWVHRLVSSPVQFEEEEFRLYMLET